MRRLTSSVILAAAFMGGGLAVVGAPAAVALPFAPCTNSAGFTCATVPVPLERGGGVAGTISLRVERRTAGAGRSQDAVLALAGGLGQATLPLAEFIAQAVAPALGSAVTVTVPG